MAKHSGYSIPTDEIKKELKILQKTNLGQTLVSLATAWIIILSCSILSWYLFKLDGVTIWTLIVYFVCNFLIATRQRLLENLIHEATHFNLCKNIKLNDFLAWTFAALPLFHNLESERKMHVHGHHGQFWNEELDPDFIRYKNMGLDQLPAESFFQLGRILINAFPVYIIDVIPAFFLAKNQKRNKKFLSGFYWTLILIIFYLSDHLIELLIYWFVPFIFTLSLIRFIAEVTEHASLGCKNEFFSSRNNIGWFNEHFIHPCGDGYHIIHHLFPKIPFFNVKRAHEILMEDPIYSKEAAHSYSFIVDCKEYKSSINSLIK